jgi:D-alanyl-D-alanine carboxypeptidase
MDFHAIQESLSRNRFWVALVIVVLLSASVFVFVFFKIASLSEDLAVMNVALSRTTNALAQNILSLRSQTVGISQTLTNTQKDVLTANSDISSVRSQVGGVEQTVGSISSTVSTLKKLSIIDPELLKKYSKVYFLNENYTPAHLTIIPQDYVYSNSARESYVTEAWPFLQKMLNAAKTNGAPLFVKSAFRSFDEQQTLKSRHVVIYGAGTANSFSADQGYSEHQLGTTVDLITSGFGGELTDALDSTPAFKWLKDNAYKFGFELSYPKANTYYIYEPWHWRFIGVKLATYLHDHSTNFYDLDQRDIDTYLADLFD